MAQENEELNGAPPVEEPVAPSDAPPDTEKPPVSPPEKPAEPNKPDTPPVGPAPDKVMVDRVELERLQKDAALTETYRSDLLNVKGKKRKSELFADISVEQEKPPNPDVPPADVATPTPHILVDYLSKRADVTDKYEQEIAQLSDEDAEFAKRRLQVEEEILKKDMSKSSRPVGRKRVEQMFEDVLGTIRSRRKPSPGAVETPPDLGSTQTIRKVAKGSAPISDRAREIQPYTKDTKGRILPLESIQAMIDQGIL